MLNVLPDGPLMRLCMGLACLLSLWNTASGIKGETKKEKEVDFLPTPVSGNKEMKEEKDEGSLAAPAPGPKGDEKKAKRLTFLATTEIPARATDLSALNLTELVNGMLSRALRDKKKFFSLLTVTSYSSFAFHKFSVAIYNISNLKTVDPTKFPTRYCYCMSNRTNDLSDFTALLVDIIGNSTSYLTEIFKSTSILSVSQTDGSDCVFICVMTGKSGRNLSDFWDMAENSPVINYTFTSSMSGILATRRMAMTSKPTTRSLSRLSSTSSPHQGQSTGVFVPRTSSWIEKTIPSEGGETITTATRRLAGTSQLDTTRLRPSAGIIREKTSAGPPRETAALTPTSPPEVQEGVNTRGLGGTSPWTVATTGSLSQTSATSGKHTPGTQTPSPTKAPAPKYPQIGDLTAAWSLTPGDELALVLGLHQFSRCPQPLLKVGAMATVPLPLAIQKINPCLMELCHFFQQCLCVSQRGTPRTEVVRYCLEHYSWFLKNATYLCQRVQRVSQSHTLKQKCLDNICKSV